MLQWRERNDIVNYSLIKIERAPITQFHGEEELTAADWRPTSSSTFLLSKSTQSNEVQSPLPQPFILYSQAHSSAIGPSMRFCVEQLPTSMHYTFIT